MTRPTEGCTYCGSDAHTTTACPMRGEHPLKDAAEFIEAFTDKAMTAHRNGEHRKFTGISTAGASPTDRDIIGEVIEEDNKLRVSPAVGEHAILESVPALREVIAERDREIELIRDALDHIARTCTQSRTQTRRLRWINYRANTALEGKPYDQKLLDIPVNGEQQAIKAELKLKALQSELAALKAQQPSGVVLPEPCTDLRMHGEYRRGHAASLDEVARLNSSPVSAGDDPFWKEKLAIKFCEQRCIADDSPVRAGLVDAFCTGLSIGSQQPASAGGVDERAIKIADRLQGLIEEMGEDGYHGSEICIAAHDYLRNLNAPSPNHSEQVPSNCRQRLAVEGKAYPKSNCAACGQFSPKWRECDAMLAAAPSAGSQGGDV